MYHEKFLRLPCIETPLQNVLQISNLALNSYSPSRVTRYFSRIIKIKHLAENAQEISGFTPIEQVP